MRRLGVALFLLLLTALPASARGKSEAWSRTQFSNAERLRQALNSRPGAERNRQDYQRVISAYRRVYYGAPTSSKADASVMAVAGLLAEMGRQLDNNAAPRSAIRHYEFLRREYPGSKYRFDALFAVGTIYQDDLGDRVRARAVFEEFVRRYPHHHLAEEARTMLVEPVEEASLKSQAKDTQDTDESGDSPAVSDNSDSAAEGKSLKLSRVTDIRHWSTPEYTRVAIDLEQNVKYESKRIERPNRVVVDLLGSELSSKLMGKTFEVDDGFLKRIRVAQFQPGKTRVVLEVDELSDYAALVLTNPSRLIIDIRSRDAQTSQTRSKDAAPGGQNEVAASARARTTKAPVTAKKQQPVLRVKSENTKPATPVANIGPPNVEVTNSGEDVEANDVAAKLQPADVRPLTTSATMPARTPDGAFSPAIGPVLSGRVAKGKRAIGPVEAIGREALPTASGDRSLIRALGLKIGRIVIDPGHGGHDTGTIGPNGLEEKDLVLDVGRRLGKLLNTRLGADVIYTRKDDTFVPLEMRTAIANREQADLFVSIHANSSRDRDARGVETYYLNFTSSREALDVAARENAVSEETIHELQDLVKKIALREKIDESREFATDVQRSLHSGLAAKSPGIRNRGVKKAPFIVLIGANMPSILAEISFVSNPVDERRLGTADYRQRIAESLYRGIAKYVSGLSGVKVASKLDKSAGQ